MKVLLTGSTGFVGLHLQKTLTDKGYHVFPLKHSILLSNHYLRGYIKKINPAYVIHLAAAGNIYGKHNNQEIVQSNIMGTFNLIEATNDMPYKAFINCSSSSVSLATKTMYSITKKTAEEIATIYATKYNKPIISVRPYTLYGPGDNESHLVPTLFRSCLKGEKIPFIPDPVHDYIYIDDFVDALIHLLDQAEASKGDIFPIGSGIQTSNQEVLNLVEEITDKKANIEIVDKLRDYDTSAWKAGTWKGNYTLKEGLQKIYEGIS